MKTKLLGTLLIVAVLSSVSCEYGNQAEEKLNEINSKADELDALINKELEQVKELDSLLPETNKKLKKADSIIDNASRTLDSLNKKVKDIENIFN